MMFFRIILFSPLLLSKTDGMIRKLTGVVMGPSPRGRE